MLKRKSSKLILSYFNRQLVVDLIRIVHRPRLVSIGSVRTRACSKRVVPTLSVELTFIDHSVSVRNVMKAILIALVVYPSVWSTKIVPALWLAEKRTVVTLVIVHQTPNAPLSTTYQDVPAHLVTKENQTQHKDASCQVFFHCF